MFTSRRDLRKLVSFFVERSCSSVRTVTCHVLDGSSLILDRGVLYIERHWYIRLFLGLERPDREADHTNSSSSQIGNVSNHISVSGA